MVLVAVQRQKMSLGNDVSVTKFLENRNAGDRNLVQGLKGDPTYIVVDSKEAIKDYGINAICTHLGCVVPWNVAENKFKCPCHGSQYDETGIGLGPSTTVFGFSPYQCKRRQNRFDPLD